MNLDLAIFLFGGLLLSIGIIGGGIEIPEIKVPKVGSLTRVLAAATGLVFIGLGIVIGPGPEQPGGGRWQQTRVRRRRGLRRLRPFAPLPTNLA